MGWTVDVDFRPSAVHGTGVFARGRIARGTRIWEVDATMRFAEPAALAALPAARLAFALHGGYLHRPTDRFIWYEDGMQYMNHAAGARANCGLDHWPALTQDHSVALRDIAAGEELFEDYGFWADAGFSDEHWLPPLYRAGCPSHFDFLRSLSPGVAVPALVEA
jgi:hypothetical protein